MSEKDCGCRQPDCFACELAATKAFLLQHGFHVVTEADKRVLVKARDVIRKWREFGNWGARQFAGELEAALDGKEWP